MNRSIRSIAARSTFLALVQPLDSVIRRAACGDGENIGQVARILRPRLVAEAMRRLGRCAQVDDAEDIVQDLFLAMLEGKVFPPDDREDPVAWLLRLVGTFVSRR